jgi:hypothetical protein
VCSVVILYRPGHRWPVLLGANRDEMLDRPWDPPARHWPDRPGVVAGRDRLAGGSWLGLNDEGVVAGILNRPNSLGPEAGRRSRGELVLEALDHADAADAAWALADLDPAAYRGFNMVIADNRNAFWLRNLGQLAPGRPAEGIEVMRLSPGISMITAHDRNDVAASPRIRSFLPQFAAAPPPDPEAAGAEAGDWHAWEALLSSRATVTPGVPYDAMAIVSETGFGTSSSSLIGLAAPEVPRAGKPGPRRVWRFAAGLPGTVPYRLVEP